MITLVVLVSYYAPLLQQQGGDPVATLLNNLQKTIAAWAGPLAIVTVAWIGVMVAVKAAWPSMVERHSGGYWGAIVGPILIVWAPLIGPWIVKLGGGK